MKDREMDKPDYEAIAAQLGKPEGAAGLETAARMNENNAEMNRFAIDVLACEDNDAVLEIGPANGKFASYVIGKATRIGYTGIDISATMVDEAHRLNKELIDKGQARFELFNGRDFPFQDNRFDKIFTVNTLYFWDDPVIQLAEIRRILKPGGVFCLGIAAKRFMEQLPFTRYGFTLYAEEEAEALLAATGFALIESFVRESERVRMAGQELVKEQVFILATK